MKQNSGANYGRLHIKIRIVSLVLCIVMMLGMFPVNVFAADVIYSGYCGGEGDGTNLTWELDSDGLLTISGTGRMKDYNSYSGTPWSVRRSQINQVRVGDDVTSLDAEACWYLTEIENVILGDGITELEASSFRKCKKLKTVVLGNNVSEIGGSAFDGCQSLTSFVVPDGVTEIKSYTFNDCTNLEKVTIGNNVKTIGECSFQDCENLKRISFPDSVTKIESWAFNDCENLTEVIIGKGVEEIDVYAFYDCVSLTDVYYVGSEEEWNNISIGLVNKYFTGANVHFNYVRENEPPADAVEFNGHYYKVYSIDTSATGAEAWAEAKAHCEELGGYLAVISSQEENDFLLDYLLSVGETNAYFGFTDEAETGVWKWVDAPETSEYVNWATNEPNSRSEHYAMFYYGGSYFVNGEWNNGSFGNGTLDDDKNYICEWIGDDASTCPTVTNLQSSYTITEGDDLSLSFTVKAGGKDGLLDVVTVREPEADKQYYRQTDINAASLNVNITISDLSTGSHTLYVYATANNFTGNPVTGNNVIATIEVTVEPLVVGIPENAQLYNGNKYYLYDKSMTWDEAKAYCEDMGGHLVTIADANEQAFLTSMVDGAAQNCYWIGATSTTGSWEWVTNEAFSYTNWKNAEPNNESGIENYAVMIAKEEGASQHGFSVKVGSWNDVSVTGHNGKKDNPFYSPDSLGFICEWEAASVKPTVTGLQSGYTLTEGQELSLNFSVKAGGTGLLNVVTIREPDADKQYYRQADINKAEHTVSTTISGLPVGLHKLVVYATATNFNGNPTNEIFEFTVTVNAKQNDDGIITKDDLCTYENIYKAMCQILERKKNDSDKKGWNNDNFLLICMAAAWTESEWQHYTSTGNVKITPNKENGVVTSNDIGLMQLNDSVLMDAAGQWLIDYITNDWVYNLEYGMGNLWTAYKEASKKYSDEVSRARGSYSRYNGGKNAGVSRWENENDKYAAHDTRFYNTYLTMKQWFAGDDGGATGSMKEIYKVFIKLHNGTESEPPVVEPPVIKQIVPPVNFEFDITFSKSAVEIGEMVTLSGTITTIGAPLKKITLSNGNEWLKTWCAGTDFANEANSFDIEYVLDTNVYGSGTYTIYASANNGQAYSPYSQKNLSLSVKHGEVANTLQVNGVIPNNDVYTLYKDTVVMIDYGDFSPVAGGLQLYQNGNQIGVDIYGEPDPASSNRLVFFIHPSMFSSGVYELHTYAQNAAGGWTDNEDVYGRIKLVQIPDLKINGKIANSASTILCNNQNDIVFYADLSGTGIDKCTVSWQGGSAIVGEITSQNKQISISKDNLANITVSWPFYVYFDKELTDGEIIREVKTLQLYEYKVNNAQISQNVNTILSYKTNALTVLEKLRADGALSSGEFGKRASALTRAFDMATFVWTTTEDVNYYSSESRKFSKNTTYYGLPYTQGLAMYNGSYCNQDNKTNLRWNDAETVVKKDGYTEKDGIYYMNLVSAQTEKGAINTYLGNDCVAMACQAWKAKNYGTTEVEDNLQGIYGTQEWYKLSHANQLQAGDILITTETNGRHVVIFLYFEEMSDGTKRVVCIEQGCGKAVLPDINVKCGTWPTVHVSYYTLADLENHEYYIASRYNQKEQNKNYYLANGTVKVIPTTNYFSWKFGGFH